MATGRRTLISPSRGWRALDVREIWNYRELLWILTERDIKVRYKQTALGVAWVILRPFLSVAIFTAVFGYLAKIPSEGYPYPVFVLSALIPWIFFSGAVAASGNSLLGSAGLIGKIYFPRLIIPMASVGSSVVDLAISAVFLLAVLPLFGVAWTTSILWVPVLLLMILCLALGVGTLFSALIVRYRDFVGLMGYLLQVWMYATPVIYPASLVPGQWRWILYLNPMAGLTEGFRAAFLGKPIEPGPIALSFFASIAIFAAGMAYFAKVERRFADII
ncbi:MAG: ABC transporter permease [Deltaproteobacteria bacterium]|nr:MAG: ABC transporter permease [Deltaproteobacteria bacterium]